MRNLLIATTLFLLLCVTSCQSPNPNLDQTGEDEFSALVVERPLKESDYKYHDIVYVPIYSDIYVDGRNQKTLLASTLSIRNTSYSDSLFISKIEYFNTQGELVREFIDNPISLPPMATVNYVIEKEDDSGGSGANFIVELNAQKKNIKPLIQAVMIGRVGNKGFAFSTDGYSVKSQSN